MHYTRCTAFMHCTNACDNLPPVLTLYGSLQALATPWLSLRVDLFTPGAPAMMVRPPPHPMHHHTHLYTRRAPSTHCRHTPLTISTILPSPYPPYSPHHIHHTPLTISTVLSSLQACSYCILILHTAYCILHTAYSYCILHTHCRRTRSWR
jgi:hypothetical protein